MNKPSKFVVVAHTRPGTLTKRKHESKKKKNGVEHPELSTDNRHELNKRIIAARARVEQEMMVLGVAIQENNNSLIFCSRCNEDTTHGENQRAVRGWKKLSSGLWICGYCAKRQDNG